MVAGTLQDGLALGKRRMIAMGGIYYCPRCHEVRIHPQPFRDRMGRILCGACWYLEGQEIEVIASKTGFPPGTFLGDDGDQVKAL